MRGDKSLDKYKCFVYEKSPDYFNQGTINHIKNTSKTDYSILDAFIDGDPKQFITGVTGVNFLRPLFIFLNKLCLMFLCLSPFLSKIPFYVFPMKSKVKAFLENLCVQIFFFSDLKLTMISYVSLFVVITTCHHYLFLTTPILPIL